METALLTILALTLGAGVAGGLLSAWSVHRRLLAQEETFKLIVTSFEDRINQLQKIVTRQDKSAAAQTRWSKKDAEIESIANLVNKPSPLHPWDPRTWGDNGANRG